MIFVTSDLHGYPLKSFQALLKKAAFTDNDYLFILGDVIDRGPEGAELLEWLLYQPNIQLLLGNHEDMMLSCAFLFDYVTEASLEAVRTGELRALHNWQDNGGKATIDGLARLKPEVRADILDYLSEAPLYESVCVGDKDFLLVHGGLGNFSPDKKMRDYTRGELLWARPSPFDRYSDQFTTIIGHTPTNYFGLGPEQRGKMLVTDTWIDIDTGAAGGLAPMLLRLDDMSPFYAD